MEYTKSSLLKLLHMAIVDGIYNSHIYYIMQTPKRTAVWQYGRMAEQRMTEWQNQNDRMEWSFSASIVLGLGSLSNLWNTGFPYFKGFDCTQAYKCIRGNRSVHNTVDGHFSGVSVRWGTTV